MSGTVCCYSGCKKSYSTDRDNVCFFKFPDDPKRRKKWMQNCGNTELENLNERQLRGKRICSDHFLPKSFNSKTTLNDAAVPVVAKRREVLSTPQKREVSATPQKREVSSSPQKRGRGRASTSGDTNKSITSKEILLSSPAKRPKLTLCTETVENQEKSILDDNASDTDGIVGNQERSTVDQNENGSKIQSPSTKKSKKKVVSVSKEDKIEEASAPPVKTIRVTPRVSSTKSLAASETKAPHEKSGDTAVTKSRESKKIPLPTPSTPRASTSITSEEILLSSPAKGPKLTLCAETVENQERSILDDNASDTDRTVGNQERSIVDQNENGSKTQPPSTKKNKKKVVKVSKDGKLEKASVPRVKTIKVLTPGASSSKSLAASETKVANEKSGDTAVTKNRESKKIPVPTPSTPRASTSITSEESLLSSPTKGPKLTLCTQTLENQEKGVLDDNASDTDRTVGNQERSIVDQNENGSKIQSPSTKKSKKKVVKVSKEDKIEEASAPPVKTIKVQTTPGASSSSKSLTASETNVSNKKTGEAVVKEKRKIKKTPLPSPSPSSAKPSTSADTNKLIKSKGINSTSVEGHLLTIFSKIVGNQDRSIVDQNENGSKIQPPSTKKSKKKVVTVSKDGKLEKASVPRVKTIKVLTPGACSSKSLAASETKAPNEKSGDTAITKKRESKKNHPLPTPNIPKASTSGNTNKSITSEEILLSSSAKGPKLTLCTQTLGNQEKSILDDNVSDTDSYDEYTYYDREFAEEFEYENEYKVDREFERFYASLKKFLHLSGKWTMGGVQWDPQGKRKVIVISEPEIPPNGRPCVKRCLQFFEDKAVRVFLDGMDMTDVFGMTCYAEKEDVASLICRVAESTSCCGVPEMVQDDLVNFPQTKKRNTSYFDADCPGVIPNDAYDPTCSACKNLQILVLESREKEKIRLMERRIRSQEKEFQHPFGKALYSLFNDLVDETDPTKPKKKRNKETFFRKFLHDTRYKMNGDSTRTERVYIEKPISVDSVSASFQDIVSKLGFNMPNAKKGKSSGVPLPRPSTSTMPTRPSRLSGHSNMFRMDRKTPVSMAPFSLPFAAGSASFTLDEGQEYELIGEVEPATTADLLEVKPNTSSQYEIIEVDHDTFAKLDSSKGQMVMLPEVAAHSNVGTRIDANDPNLSQILKAINISHGFRV